MIFGKTWKQWWQKRHTPGAAAPPQRRPRFQTEVEVQKYVENQLTNGLPSNWSYRQGRHPLRWHIEPQVRTDKVAGTVDFVLEVSGDYRLFIIYYGNTDAGCCIRYLSTAMVMSREHLSQYSLTKAVTEVIEHRQLNTWGLT